MKKREKSTDKPVKTRSFAPALNTRGGIATAVSIIGITALLSIAAMLYIQRNGGLCLLLGTTGIPCPGCGLTRATLSALRGDIATAFAYHPLFFAPYVMIGMWLVSSRFSGMKKAAFITVIVLAAAMIVCWIIRLIGGWNGYLTP